MYFFSISLIFQFQITFNFFPVITPHKIVIYYMSTFFCFLPFIRMFDANNLPVMMSYNKLWLFFIVSFSQNANLFLTLHSIPLNMKKTFQNDHSKSRPICTQTSTYLHLHLAVWLLLPPTRKIHDFKRHNSRWIKRNTHQKLHWHLLIHHRNPDKKIWETAAPNTLKLWSQQHYNLELDWKVSWNSAGHCCSELYSVACRIQNDFTQTKLLWSVNMFSKADKKECWCQEWQELLSLRVHSRDTA